MKHNKTLIAAAYIRVSTDDQTEYSPDAQKKALKKYADTNNMYIPEEFIFVDEGISGRKAEKRPAFMQMISMAKSKDHPFDVILVHKFDRFARSREDSVVYKSMLKKECGVRVISITESIEDDKFSVILEAMLEAMAEYYSINLSDEVKKGMTEKALRGELQTTAPFGYAVKDNVLVPVPEEAEIVKTIFARFVGGEGYLPVARYVNSLGIKTHRGNPFEHRTIEYIIRNPVYIGKLRWNPTGRSKRNFDDENIITADAKHKPIIDEETWNAAQRRMRMLKEQFKYHARPASEKKHWISGIVRCSECNATLIWNCGKYKCGNYLKGRCSHSQAIPQDELERALVQRLETDTGTFVPVEYFSEIISLSSKDVNLEKQEQNLKKKLDRLREAYLNGVETLDNYKKIKYSIDSELELLEKQKKKQNQKRNTKDDLKLLKSAIAKVLEVINDEKATLEQKNEAASGLISTCSFSSETNCLKISYRLMVD